MAPIPWRRATPTVTQAPYKPLPVHIRSRRDTGAEGMPEYTKFPYRSEFPDSSERPRNHQSLEDALDWSRRIVHSRWREDNEFGREGEYAYEDMVVAVITNRNTGYRWI